MFCVSLVGVLRKADLGRKDVFTIILVRNHMI
ncbi:hypothetical protein BV97_05538 [Novosphingobium resinovorum]|uniref:Uncharacterized protein n=1 Tax=Novosphingobium resinovorum TaxID=158500 RepID=A0A031J7C3_9SPHN|nr:hypothetical protein BV97_05538 [Novosphingobium resinovorum]